MHVFHAWNRGTQVKTWFEYVPSDANPGDEPSRDDTLTARNWAVMSGIASTPVQVRFPPTQRWSDPAGWAQEGEAAAKRQRVQ